MSTAPFSRIAFPLIATCYAAFFLYVAITAFRHPALNWDMVAYIGVVESIHTSEPTAIYESTMEEAKKAYPPGAYHHLTEMNKLSDDSLVFYQQLPFYKIKPLYIAGMYALSGLGMEKYAATYVLSILGCLIIGLVLFLLRPPDVNRNVWPLLLLVIFLIKPWHPIGLAALSTPDSLSIALSLAGFYWWQVRKSFRGFALCMILAQLARPDALMLTLFLLLYYGFIAEPSMRMSRNAALLLGCSTCVLYFAVNYLGGNYGWETLFYYKFYKKLPLPADTEVVIGLTEYFAVLYKAVMHMLWNPRIQWLAAASIVAGVIAVKQVRFRSHIVLLLIIWSAFLCRFAFFPAWGEDRYYYAYYLLLLYVSAGVILPCAQDYFLRLTAKGEKAC